MSSTGGWSASSRSAHHAIAEAMLSEGYELRRAELPLSRPTWSIPGYLTVYARPEATAEQIAIELRALMGLFFGQKNTEHRFLIAAEMLIGMSSEPWSRSSSWCS